MAWRRIGGKPFSEPMLIFVTDLYAAFGLNELSYPIWYENLNEMKKYMCKNAIPAQYYIIDYLYGKY